MQLAGVLLDVSGDPDDDVLVEQVGALLADVRAELVTDRLVQVLGQGEPEVGQDPGARVLAAEDEHALVRGGHHRARALELGVLVGRGLDGGLGLLDDPRGLVRLAEGLADRLRQLLPGDAEVVVLLRLGDDGRELGQLLVLLLGQAAVERKNQVRLERRDLLHLRAGAGVLQDDGCLAPAQLVLGPRADRALVSAQPLGGADRDLAERQHRVLVGEADGDDPLRFGLDGRTAVLVRDGDGEGGLPGGARLRTGTGGVGSGVVPAAGRGGGEEQKGRGERGDEPWRCTGAEHQRSFGSFPVVRGGAGGGDCVGQRVRGAVRRRGRGSGTRPPTAPRSVRRRRAVRRACRSRRSARTP